MRSTLYAQLLATARRQCRDKSLADDLVQEAFLAAILAGRTEFESPEIARWLTGTVRNQAKMLARSASRRRRREGQWLFLNELDEKVDQSNTTNFVDALPKSLKAVATLTLSGHNRREIAYLLGLRDATLRQRIVSLRRKAIQAGLATPSELPGLELDIAYGRIRGTLLPTLLRLRGTFASHDPDGHLFLIRGSQKSDRRQQAVQSNQET